MSTPSTLIADRYRLINLLGTGGMGVVWQAWDERLQRPVALKMLRTQPELTDRERETATNRAMREARITAGLHHPHAVTVFDVVEHEGRPCIVMQLIESTPLSMLLREHGPLNPGEAARIGAQVSSALAAAHKMRIVHRDVTPGNILITEDGSALISDFGISHALGDATITATGMIHGTPAYLSPEVARGQQSRFASDVFSLGSTLYAMLEGAPPFGADNNAIALLHKVARGVYPPPKHAGVLAPLLRDMLAADPKRRPSMKSVASRLSAISERAEAAAAPAAATPAAAAPAAASDSPTVPVAAASESPTVPLSGAAAALAADGLAAATAETREIGSTAETEPLGRGNAQTDRREEAAPDKTEPPPALAWLVQGPPTSPPTEVTRTEPEPEPLGRRRAAAVIAILLLVSLLVLGGAFLIGQFRVDAGNAGDPGADETPAASQAPDAATSPSATPSPSPSPSPSPAPEPSPVAPSTPPPAEEPPPPSAEQRVADALTSYYTLVPGDLNNAWSLMTADYQVNHVGGRGAYDAFWGAIADVEIADVSVAPPDTAQATLTYYFHDGSVVQEVTAYRLVDEGGVLKIAATDVLSSVEQ